MKRLSLLVLVAILSLCLYPQPAQAQEIADINIGGYYATHSEAFGMSVMGYMPLEGGLFQLGFIGSFGAGDNSASFIPGLFLVHGGTFELGLLSGVVSKWDDDVNYIAGTNGLYATYKLSLCRIFGQWQREWPFDSDGALQSSHKFTVGVSLPIK